MEVEVRSRQINDVSKRLNNQINYWKTCAKGSKRQLAECELTKNRLLKEIDKTKTNGWWTEQKDIENLPKSRNQNKDGSKSISDGDLDQNVRDSEIDSSEHNEGSIMDPNAIGGFKISDLNQVKMHVVDLEKAIEHKETQTIEKVTCEFGTQTWISVAHERYDPLFENQDKIDIQIKQMEFHSKLGIT